MAGNEKKWRGLVAGEERWCFGVFPSVYGMMTDEEFDGDGEAFYGRFLWFLSVFLFMCGARLYIEMEMNKIGVKLLE